MYSCETDPLTQKQLHELRVISAVAMNYDWGPTNRVAAMLFSSQGLMEPKALYYYRVLKNWCRQMMMCMGVTPLVSAYWVAACSDPGTTKGPTHLVTKILAGCGARGTPTLWHVPRYGFLDILLSLIHI